MRSIRRRRPMADINVVPFIDVMLVLLVIFMITTPLLMQGVKVELPKAQAKVIQGESQAPLIVTVDKFGHAYLIVSETPDKFLPPHTLLTRVTAELRLSQAQGQSRQVFVKGDAQAHYGVVVETMALLQKAGVAQVGLMTSLPKRQKFVGNQGDRSKHG